MTLSDFIRRYRITADSSGMATIEFALATTILMLGLLNGLELARFSHQKMELKQAVHSAVHAAWNACDTRRLPAKTNCPGLTTAISNGLQSTSLGTSVSLSANYPAEAYYCLNSSGALRKVAEYNETKPADCTAVVSGDTRKPADYLTVQATYTYTPMFGAKLTFGNLMATTLTSTSLIRLQ